MNANDTKSTKTESQLSSISDAVEAIAAGRFVIVVDDEDRENEGDLICAASKATPEHMAFLMREARGLVCCAITEVRANALDLPLMVEHNTEVMKTAFTVSVDVHDGTTTGISASDRALTVNALANEAISGLDFARPGHIFPLRARDGGVLKRAGHTEAAVDLARMAGLEPCGVLCEIANDDGTMARLPELLTFAEKHDLPIISIADLIKFRNRHEKLVEARGSATVPTPWGDFTVTAFRDVLDGVEHVAYSVGDFAANPEPPLIRVHSECLTGDIFGSLRCDCGSQLRKALKMIGEAGYGAVIYLRGHEGRGIGLGHKLRAYALQDEGMDTVEANEALGFPPDKREYGIGAQMLADLGVTKMRLLTNNPTKYGGLAGYNLEIVERVPLLGDTTPENQRYLDTKRERMGHLLEP